ncbi:MAG: hypothetical protein RLZZ59_818 [Pseudomonadota bacterium]|jgi:hypothetical protein
MANDVAQLQHIDSANSTVTFTISEDLKITGSTVRIHTEENSDIVIHLASDGQNHLQEHQLQKIGAHNQDLQHNPQLTLSSVIINGQESENQLPFNLQLGLGVNNSAFYFATILIQEELKFSVGGAIESILANEYLIIGTLPDDHPFMV